MVYKWLKNNHIKSCLLCHQRCQEACGICQSCQSALPYFQTPCYQCGLPLIKNSHVDDIKAKTSGYKNTPQLIAENICGQCISSKPIQERTFSPFAYLFPLPELIQAIKFNKQVHYAPALAQLFSLKLKQAYAGDKLPDLIVPVPLYRNRQFARGFNQAHLLAIKASQQLDIPMQSDLIVRHKNTPSQISLKIKERNKNVSRAFGVNKQATVNLEGKHLAIFDDIVTTGATTRAIAKLLAAGGCGRIDIWCIARTPKPG